MKRMSRLLKEKPSYSLQARGSKGRFYFPLRGVASKGGCLISRFHVPARYTTKQPNNWRWTVDGAPGEPGFRVWNRDRGLFRWE